VKRGPRVFLILLVCYLIAVIAWVALRDREPEYKGKSLSDWLRVGHAAKEGSIQAKEAAFAIRQMGTNVLPYLLSAVSSKRVRPTKWLTIVAGERHLETVEGKAAERAFAAEFGFRALGHEASPGVPQLAKLLSETNLVEPSVPVRALAAIGEDGFTHLLNAFSNENHVGRSTLAYYIVDGYLNANEPAAALRFWLECLNSPDTRVVNSAAISAPSLDSAVAVPALAEATRQSNVFTRSLIIDSLGKFGKRASQAVPALTNCLVDPQQRVRSAATNALMQIAPEALTNGVAK